MPEVAFTDESGFTEKLFADSAEYRRYYETSLKALETGLQILSEESWHKKEGWKAEHQSLPPQHNLHDQVHSKNLAGIGKVFVYTGELHCDAQEIFSVIYERCEDTPLWSPATVVEFQKILDVGTRCSLIYNRTCDMFGGLFKSREFVQARCWREIDGSIVLCSCEADYQKAPKHKSSIRGETIIGFVKLSPSDDDPTKCVMTWIQYSDLKGMVPKALLDRVYGFAMVEYIKNLRNHLGSLQAPRQ